MKTHKPVALARFIAGGSDVCAVLLEHTQRLLQLTRTLQEHLPEPLNRHCAVANIHNDSLVLITDSPVWSSRLRFHAPVLLRELERRHAVRLKNVLIKISPEVRPSPRPRVRRATMSNATAALLEQVAGSVTDPALSGALHRLARHSRN